MLTGPPARRCSRRKHAADEALRIRGIISHVGGMPAALGRHASLCADSPTHLRLAPLKWRQCADENPFESSRPSVCWGANWTPTVQIPPLFPAFPTPEAS